MNYSIRSMRLFRLVSVVLRTPGGLAEATVTETLNDFGVDFNAIHGAKGIAIQCTNLLRCFR